MRKLMALEEEALAADEKKQNEAAKVIQKNWRMRKDLQMQDINREVNKALREAFGRLDVVVFNESKDCQICKKPNKKAVR